MSSRPTGDRIRKPALLLLLTGLLLAWTACGGGSSSSTTTGTVSVTINPQSAILRVTTSQQFSAGVVNTSNTNITWEVNGTAGGSATFGTISTSGLYTAPSTVPTGTVTVTAVSQQDTSKTASATVTITSANSLMVAPAQVNIAAGAQQTFSATLGGQAVDVSWSLICGDSTTGGCGTIQGNGVYTAPLSPPTGQSVTVVAKSPTNVAAPANANVTVTYGNGTLLGPYSFELTGVNAGQPFTSVGSITFDGKGGITAGVEDRPGQTTPITITGGTYTSDTNGRVSVTVHTDSGDEGWQIMLVNHSVAFVTRVDSVIARGDLRPQSSTQFATPLTGNFSFRLAGTSAGAIPVAAEVGALTFDQQGNITSGLLDVNDGGTVTTSLAASGTATTSSATNGRGTLSISSGFGTQTFAYYVIDANRTKLIEIDGTHDLFGKLVFRTSSTTVSAGDFQGSYGFVFSGANSSGPVGQGGTFHVDNNGNISNGVFDSSSDAAFALGFLLSGSFAVADPVTGRTVVTFNAGGTSLQYVVYPPDLDDAMALLEIDAHNVTTGVAVLSSNAANGTTVPSVSGHFAMQAAEANTALRRIVGGDVALSFANGSSAPPTGSLDVNDAGSLTLNTALQNSSFSLTSLFGRGAMQLNAGAYSASYTVYLVDNGTLLVMETDGKGVLTGVIQERY